jgi:hypothetical protein
MPAELVTALTVTPSIYATRLNTSNLAKFLVQYLKFAMKVLQLVSAVLHRWQHHVIT